MLVTRSLSVLLIDFVRRGGRYALPDFYDRHRNPGTGIVAMLAGILASVPFWDQSLWHGPVVDLAPQVGDLSFIVGFVVAGLVYVVLRRHASRAVAR